MDRQKKSLVIFDLDGTLLNTITDLGHAANYALEKNGYPTHHLSSYPHFVGNGIRRLIERVLPAEDRTEDIVTRMRADFIEYYNDHLTDTTVPYPGIEDMLRDLQAAGVKMAVATNKYQSAATKLILHFFPYISWVAIAGQKEGVPVKPDPSVVFGILGEYPTPKAEVMMVGDSGVDIETARRACVESTGVSWGFRSVAELTEAYADHIINAPDELVTLVGAD
ncbi:MAG: HAD-IA family hydrolase [Muribaculaceae bacterium]|nr:HAD-IA family hydrolase [Muribaculaceae bacterium]